MNIANYCNTASPPPSRTRNNIKKKHARAYTGTIKNENAIVAPCLLNRGGDCQGSTIMDIGFVYDGELSN